VGGNGNGFLGRLKPWQVVIAAVIGGVTAIVVALIGSSPSVSAVSSNNPRITIIQPNPGPAPGSGGTPAAGGATTSSPSAVSSSPPPTYPRTSGRWIAQLASIPFSDGPAERDRELQQIQGTIPQAQWLSSDDYGSLSPGFWVVYVDAQFSDGAAAFRFCLQHGRSTEIECVGRYLSDNADDHSLQCFWSGAENPGAACYEKSTS